MILSTQTDLLALAFGYEKAVEMICDGGFDAIDFSFFPLDNPECPLFGDEAEELMVKLRTFAESRGVIFNQAHAPFGCSPQDEADYKNRVFPKVTRAMKLASILGVKIIVVHPLHHMVPYKGNEKMYFDINVQFYKDLIPYCEKYNIKVAAENMWQRDKNRGYIVHDTCSTAKCFNAYLDAVNSPWIVGCLDLGHCGLVGEDAAEMIRAMGNKHIKALHVHDNDHKADLHVPPFYGKMDWESITKALADIGYDGDFTFESDNVYSNMPADFKIEATKYMVKIGRKLISMIDNYKELK